MANGRRSPGIFTVLAVLLLVGPLGFAGWYFFRPKPDDTPPVRGEDLDVVCTGRVDAPKTVTSLEPAQAGRVVEVCVEEGAEVSQDAPILKLDDAMARVRLRQAEAAVRGIPVALTPRRLTMTAARHPLMTQRVSALIRVHGIWLWARRLPMYTKAFGGPKAQRPSAAGTRAA